MATAINSTEIAKELSALIETRVQRTFEFVNTYPVGGSPQSMQQFLRDLDTYVWSFQEPAPLASWLRGQGIPAPASRLDFVIEDLGNARRKWVEMHSGMLSARSADSRHSAMTDACPGDASGVEGSRFNR